MYSFLKYLYSWIPFIGNYKSSGSGTSSDIKTNSIPDTINSSIPDTINSSIPDTINSSIPDTINSTINSSINDIHSMSTGTIHNVTTPATNDLLSYMVNNYVPTISSGDNISVLCVCVGGTVAVGLSLWLYLYLTGSTLPYLFFPVLRKIKETNLQFWKHGFDADFFDKSLDDLLYAFSEFGDVVLQEKLRDLGFYAKSAYRMSRSTGMDGSIQLEVITTYLREINRLLSEISSLCIEAGYTDFLSVLVSFLC